MKITGYLVLALVSAFSGQAFCENNKEITYKSCEIHISSSLRSIYTVNAHRTRSEMSVIDDGALIDIYNILVSKGYFPYFDERRDGLSLRQKYTQNVNTSFGIYYHSLYANLDIIESGEYSQFENFKRSSVKNFDGSDFDHSLLKTIVQFPTCIEK